METTVTGANLSVIDMRVAFRGVRGLRLITSEVCFGLGLGERISLIGESGTGKTVTALALCGLLDADPGLIRGQVLLNGRDLYSSLAKICREDASNGSLRVRKSRAKFQKMLRNEVRPVARKSLGLIFQEAKETLDPLRTVGRQLVEALEQSADRGDGTDPKDGSRRLLQRLGFDQLQKALSAYPHELSGGMAQRIGIALALASRPSILIADEPTSALDAVLQKQVADLILELQRKDGWALLLITHNLRLAEYMTERILVMYGGQIVEVLPSNQLSMPATKLHPYTEQLRDAVSSLYGRRLSILDLPESTAGSQTTTLLRSGKHSTAGPTPCPFAAKCPRKNDVPLADRGRCDFEMPEFRPVGDEGEHLARCWIY